MAPAAVADAGRRLFLALWPDDEVRGGLAAWRDLWSWPSGASPTRTERLHMTLHFIGQVGDDRLAGLCEALSRTGPIPEFTLELGRAELWPHGIAVVCPVSAPAALLQLHARLGATLGLLGLPVEERPLRAHVTLARRAQRAVLPMEGPSLRWHVRNGFALVQSMPGGRGYQVLRTFR